MRLRSVLHRRGLRYRVEYAARGLPRRRLDIAFPGAKIAVLVDGCFWHGCPDHCVEPKANAAWWRDKLAENRRRDAATDAALARLDWQVIRVWEHEDPEVAADAIAAAVASRRQLAGGKREIGRSGTS
jgi:DNA mismatch endonuclease (patch repair protein)